MKGRKLYEALGDIDGKYLDLVDAAEQEAGKRKHKHFSARKTILYLLAAAICVSLLGVTAAAAGWIPNIFAAVEPAFQKDAEILEAALEVTQTQEPETIEIPDADYTKITLFERYYDGDSVILGYDLSKVMPEPIVDFKPDAELLKEIKKMPFYSHTPYPGMTDDTLELKVELGILSQEEYEQRMESRSDYAKKYNLHKEWQLYMDEYMQLELSPEQYEQFWKILIETGSCCVALPSKPWVGDHILVNGHDMFETYAIGTNEYAGRVGYTTDVGDCILLNPLPTKAQDQSSVTVKLKIKSGWEYWYMELDGDMYHIYKSNPDYDAAFTLENVNNP